MYRKFKWLYYLLVELSNNFDIKTRDKNKRTNLGNIYLDKIYTVNIIIIKVNITSFVK